MTWIPLLLAEKSPSLRYLVLRDLLNHETDDEELVELDILRNDDEFVKQLRTTQQENGSWSEIDEKGGIRSTNLRATSFALQRLAYLGPSKSSSMIKRGVEYLFSEQAPDGSWAMPGAYDGISDKRDGYTMAPLQTSIPLLGIASCGYADDKRAEKGYSWLLDQRLDDGAWPTGKIGEVFGYQAGYRKMPNSKWGCRTNTTLALSCLSFHPKRRTSDAARRALDLLLARETRDRKNLGYNVARLIGVEAHRGHLTYHARFDPALVLDLCWRIGATTEDERVRDLIKWIQESRNEFGIWEYQPDPSATRWITFDILRSLQKIDSEGEWATSELRTRYQSYPSRKKRF